MATVALLALFVWAIQAAGERRVPQSPTEIFEGITYGCDRLEPSDEGNGLLHWVRIFLTAPGIEPYVTPLDAAAVEHGWEYRLQWIADVVRGERLAVAINGSLFASRLGSLRIPGDFARGVETNVADHVVSHVLNRGYYLLWFDDHLAPHLDRYESPTAAEFATAKWGIGALGVGLWDGKVPTDTDRTQDSRTAVGIDPDRNLLFLAVGEHISPRLMLQKLARLGAQRGMLLDGGNSSAMTIGPGAKQVRPGVLHGGWVPSANFFGVRARSLDQNTSPWKELWTGDPVSSPIR